MLARHSPAWILAMGPRCQSTRTRNRAATPRAPRRRPFSRRGRRTASKRFRSRKMETVPAHRPTLLQAVWEAVALPPPTKTTRPHVMFMQFLRVQAPSHSRRPTNPLPPVTQEIAHHSRYQPRIVDPHLTSSDRRAATTKAKIRSIRIRRTLPKQPTLGQENQQKGQRCR